MAEQIVMSFEKPSKGYYVSEFTSHDAVAVHITRKDKGDVIIEQSSVNDGNYVTVDKYIGGTVLDFELNANVFPKYWRIKSETEVISGVYTEGE